MPEVCRVHSTNRRRNYKLLPPMGKEQITRKSLNPHYVVGFIDGEGSFSVSINHHKTLKSRVEIKPEFEIELRADDREILERIAITIGSGIIYDCSYERYGWYPHSKYKISSTKEMAAKLFPFLDRYRLQAKKRKCYVVFKKIVGMMLRKQHLTAKGLEKIRALREQIRKLGKKPNGQKARETARIRENRSSGGVKQ